jgi:monoamine oxidase
MIDRRRFLGLSASAAAPFIARKTLAAGLQAPAGDSADPVVVVGAGLAGLRAASVLKDAGRRVIVLEANGYPGGRVRTIRTFGEGLYGEAGAIRIPAAHTAVLTLVRQHGLSVVPFWSSSGSSLVSVGGVTSRVPDDLKALTGPLSLKPDEAGLTPTALLRQYVGQLPAGLSDPELPADGFGQWADYDRVTWPDWLRSRGASPGAVTLMTLGGDSRELSALYVLRQLALVQGTSEFYKIRDGMDQLPRRMGASLGAIVRYNSAVVRIDQRAAPVRVDYRNNETTRSVRASRVILTIPFSTLRHVEIQPPFSHGKTRAIETLPYFPATRFLLQSRHRFWHESGLSGSARTDDPMEIWDAAYDLPAERGLLGATVGGAIGQSLEKMSRPKALAFGTDLVARTLPAIRSQFEKGSAYRWGLDPWARGAFAVFRPGQMTTLMPDLSRPEGDIHFAGEHTSPWMGWMEGALESGERAAREVLAGRSERRDAVR